MSPVESPSEENAETTPEAGSTSSQQQGLNAESESGIGAAAIPVDEATAANRMSPAMQGTLAALTAATAYSIANLGLKQLSTFHNDAGWSLWVAASKSGVTTLITLFVLLATAKGRLMIPQGRALAKLAFAALLTQLGGNGGFQVSLSHIGLAVSVPIVFSSIIVTGAVAGRFFLNEPITARTTTAMSLMIAAIVMLSAASGTAAEAVTESELVSEIAAGAQVASGSAVVGVLIALVSGVSYGFTGVVIRRSVRSELPLAGTMIVFSLMGTLGLGLTGGSLLGAERLVQISSDQWWLMLFAGTLNAAGFFGISYALKMLTVSRANVYNSAQNAMCAVGAWLVFGEPVSLLTVGGISLTVLGLLVLDRS